MVGCVFVGALVGLQIGKARANAKWAEYQRIARMPPPDSDWLVEQVASPTIDCACCRPWLDDFTENVRTLLAHDPDEWDLVNVTPVPPRPTHIAGRTV